MDLLIILIIALAILGGGIAPVWPHSHELGYFPMSAIFFVVIILVIVYALRGRGTPL